MQVKTKCIDKPPWVNHFSMGDNFNRRVSLLGTVYLSFSVVNSVFPGLVYACTLFFHHFFRQGGGAIFVTLFASPDSILKPSKMGSTLKRKNLLQGQILSFIRLTVARKAKLK